MGSVGEGVAVRAAKMLGRGFDLTCDFRLNFCKGAGSTSSRLVELDESNVRDVHIPGVGSIPTVPRDIGCDKGDRIRFRSDVLEFNQASDFLDFLPFLELLVLFPLCFQTTSLNGRWRRFDFQESNEITAHLH